MSRPATEPVPPGAPTLASGRYAVVSRIDAGGMSAVYRVWDRKLKVARAMKVLLPEYARNHRIHQRFESEARTMARLEHPNLVRIYDVGTEAGLPYLVMELVTGGSLQRWIETHGAMPPQLAIEAAAQLTSGLVAVHAAGVVHRDIKPHNVLIAEPGICKLTDFGIAHLGDSGSTKTGSTLGTQGYMAPEQRADAKSVDGRADLYGVGATLWALLTGKPAHDVFLLVERGGLAAAPAYLQEILRKTVAYSRDERFPDAATLLAALQAARQVAPRDRVEVDLPLDDTTDEAPLDPVEDEIAAIIAGGTLGGAAEPVSGAGVPPAAASSSATPGHASTPSPLPYYMPTVDRPRRGFSQPAAADDEPDWIARDEPAGSYPVEEVIGAGVSVRDEDAPADPAAPPVDDPVDEPGAVDAAASAADEKKKAEDKKKADEKKKAEDKKKADEKKKAEEDKKKAEEDKKKAEEDAGEGSSLWVFLLAPVAALLLGALLLVLVSGGVVAMSASGIRGAEADAVVQREQVYRVLEDEGGAVQRFKVAGIDATNLESAYLAFEDAKGEPARQEAARAYLAVLDAESERWLGPDSSSATQMEAAHAVRRIRARVAAWDAADAAWVDAGSGIGGRIAILLGLVRPPPDLGG